MPFTLLQNAIQIPSTDISIRVYDLTTESFKQLPGELTLFAVHDHQYFAFEVRNWEIDQLDRVTAAIKWYGRKINRPSLDIILNDPRPARTLRLA